MNTSRTLAEVQLPAAGLWQIDPSHAEVAFVGRHFGLTKVRGRFVRVAGRVAVGDDTASSSVEVTIDMASVSSGDAARDDHLRSADFFDVGHHPTATFRSTGVDVTGGTGTMRGAPTLQDIAKEGELTVDYLGFAVEPSGNQPGRFCARRRPKREGR